MNYDTLQRCKKLMEALEVDTTKVDDLIELEALRRRERLTESQVDALIELLTTYRYVVSAI